MLCMVNLEAAGVDHEYNQLRGQPTEGPSIPTCATLACRNLTDSSRSLEALNRFEARLQRQFDSAFDRLCRLRVERERQFTKDGVIPPRGNPRTEPIPSPDEAL